jgi:hypothetical protein
MGWIEIRLFDALQGILCEACLLRWGVIPGATARNIFARNASHQRENDALRRAGSKRQGGFFGGCTPFIPPLAMVSVGVQVFPCGSAPHERERRKQQKEKKKKKRDEAK